MSDHHPQCFLATACKHDYYDEPPVQCANCGEECICDRLRACESRVLDAAREAVAALPMMKIAGNFPLYDADDALAAIDALMNDSSDNGTKVQDTP